MKKSSVEISGAEAIILQRPGFAGAAPRDKERWLLHEHGYGSLRVSLDPSLWRGALEPPGARMACAVHARASPRVVAGRREPGRIAVRRAL